MLSPSFSPVFANWVETMASPNTTLTMEYDATTAMLNGMETQADAQAAFDSMDDASRVMGQWATDNNFSAAYHPVESSGAAYVLLEGDGTAIFASWDDAGFWDVTFCTQEEARLEINRLDAEYDFNEDCDLEEEEEEE